MDPVLAVVQTWDDDEGWGVCSASEVPGGCWVHFSVLDVPGFRRLAVGDSVWLVVEAAEQDGYSFRAARCWPVTGTSGPDQPPLQVGSAAYSSRLHLSFDEQDRPASR